MVGPGQILKDIKLLSDRLRRLHLYIPPTTFLRQIVVRPAKEEDNVSHINSSSTSTWKPDDSLEDRAAILRKRIEDTYRKEYSDVLDCEPT